MLLKVKKERYHDFNPSKSTYLYVRSLILPDVAVTVAS